VAAPQFVASSPATGSITGSTSQSVPAPAGLSAGHILIAVVSHRGTGAPSGPPSGFTLAASETGTGSDARTGWGGLYWKRASGSETTIAVTGGTDSTTLGVTAWSGCIASGDPIDAIDSRLNTLGGSSGADAITTTVGDARVIGAAAIFDNRAVSGMATATDGAMTDHLGLLNSTGDDSGAAIASLAKTSPGSTGDLSWSMVFSTNVGFLFALKPAAAGTASAQAATATAAGQNATVAVDEPSTGGMQYVASSGTTGANVTTLVVDIPGSPASTGDFAILAATVTPGTISTPAGWSLPDGFPLPVTNSGGRMYAWTKTLESGDIGSTVTLTADSSSRIAGGCLVTDPGLIDALQVDATNTGGTVVTVPSVDPVSQRAILVVLAGSISNVSAEQPTWTQPLGMALRQNRTSTSASVRNATLLIATKSLSSGDPTGVQTATASLAVQRQAATFAIRTSAAETNAAAEAALAVGEALFDAAGQSVSVILEAVNPIGAASVDLSPSLLIPPQQDDFNDGSIADIWTIVDPAGDCLVTATGSTLQLEAPETEHNQRGLANNRDALKVLQGVGGDETAWLRADVTRNGDGTLHAVCLTTEAEDGATTARVDSSLPDLEFTSSIYVRLARVGHETTFYTSPNGRVWTQRALFTWTQRISRLGPMLLKDVSANPSVVDVDFFRDTAAVGTSTEVQALAADGVGEAFGPDSVNIVRTASGRALDPQIVIHISAITAEATGVASAHPGVGPSAGAEAVAAALNAIGDRSDRGDVYYDALGSASALQPTMSVGVHAITA
jgi:hypothetical protein